MSAKHTPGPWRVVSFTARGSDDGCYVGISSEHHSCLAEVVIRMKDEPPSLELLANAHLIAAAPDLLAALRAMLDDDDHDAAKVKARAAIAAATGEKQ
jgi:hypothetical protein